MTLMQTRAQLGNLFSNAEGKNLKKPVKTHAHTDTHTHIYIYISHTDKTIPKKRWPYFIRGGVILSRGLAYFIAIWIANATSRFCTLRAYWFRVFQGIHPRLFENLGWLMVIQYLDLSPQTVGISQLRTLGTQFFRGLPPMSFKACSYMVLQTFWTAAPATMGAGSASMCSRSSQNPV